jgi:UDP-glucuronate decarboxylase
MTYPTLVLGAAGFIGSHLVDALLAQGETVIGLDNLSTGHMSNLAHASTYGMDRFTFALHDVRNPLPTWAPIVFNLACPASPVAYGLDPVGTLETSVVGALRLLEAYRKRPFLIVHASTSEVYGNPKVFPQPEYYWGNVNPIGVRSCYDEGKRAAEALFVSSRAAVRIARIFNTYGTRMAWNDGRAVPAFVQAAVNNQPIVLRGGGQTRSFCYVTDLVRGLLKLADPSKGHLSGQPINLGNSTEITIMKLAETVLRLAGASPDAMVFFDPTPDDPERRCPDLSLAQQLLNYVTTVDLEQGLSLVIAEARRRQKWPGKVSKAAPVEGKET